MWIILTVMFLLTTLILLLIIKNKNDEIKALEYAINIEVTKAMQEWKRTRE